jgi:membrane dipeptidase
MAMAMFLSFILPRLLPAASPMPIPSSMTHPVPIFDGHNDVLLRLMHKRGGGGDHEAGAKAFLEGTDKGHLDLPRARAGGFTGGLFAVFCPPIERSPGNDELMKESRYDIPLPPGLALTDAQQAAIAMIAGLFRIERSSKGAVRICRSAADIDRAGEAGALAAVLHIEGAEPIDADFRMLDILYQAGLRSIGPVWSRSNIFGHGVPFRFPSSPDTGPGLTDAGKALVRACNELKVLIDLSHLNEKGFWDVAKLSDAPLVASHSNAHAVSPHSRNLTDDQLRAVRDSGGLVGINYATSFLREDGRMNADTPLEQMVRHADHLIGILGADGVGLGSDFDGAVIPAAISDVAGLPRLVEAFRSAGYDEETIRKICRDNWVSVLRRTWGE